MTYILYDMTTDSHGVFSASSEDENFPLSNIRIQSLAKKLKFTGKTSEIINYLNNDGMTVDGIGLQTNLTDAGTVTIDLYAHAIIDGGSSVQVGTDILDGGSSVQVGTDILDGTPTIASTINLTGANANDAGVIYYQLATTQEILSMTFTFADSANTENISIGRLAMGQNLQLTDPRQLPVIEYNDTSMQKISQSGQLYGVQGYTFRIFDVSFPNITEAQKVSLKNMLNTVGIFKPFFLSVLDTIEDEVYATIDQNSFAFTHQPYEPTYGYTLNIKFREVF